MTDLNSELMAQMREDFLAESQEILERLGPLLTRLEKEQTAELVNTIFRELHTLKGTAGFVGIIPIHRLAHKMEDVFGEVRAEQLAINPVLIDAAFAGVHLIEAMREDVKCGGNGTVDATEVIARFSAIQRGEMPPERSISVPSPQTISSETTSTESSSPTMPTGDEKSHIAQETTNAEPELSLAELRRALELELKGKSKPQPVIAPITIEPAQPTAMASISVPIPAASVPVLPEITALPASPPTTPTTGNISAKIDTTNLTNQNVATPYNAVEDAQRESALQSALLIANKQELGNKNKSEGATQIVNNLANLIVNTDNVTDPAPTGVFNTVQFNRGNMPGLSSLDLSNSSRAMPARGETTIRVDIEMLDSLMLLVGELITARNTLIARSEILRDEPLNGCAAAIGRLTKQLQMAVTNVRLVPVERLFNRFAPVVRNLARERDMQVHLEIEGGETPLDRTVLEQMSDPFVHLLRNAIDHGLESMAIRQQSGKPERGTIRLTAERRGDDVTLKISDDGRGIDPARIRTIAVQRGICSEEDVMALSDEQALRLIFAPGFSTAATITDISGRGVGMDVVLQNVRRLRGNIEIDTRVGEGTTFIIKLPLTLAILQVLLVRVGEYIYSLPLHAVRETLLLMPDAIQILQQREVAFIRNVAVPVRYLKDLLDQNGNGQLDHDMTPAVIVRMSHGDEILVVDELVGKQQVVIKPLSPYLGSVKGIEGSAILPDGSVSLILDVDSLIA